MQNNRIHFWKATSVGAILVFCLGIVPLAAQDPFPKLPDSLNVVDSVPVAFSDTFPSGARTIRFSSDSLDAPVEYNAVDSMVLDNIAKKIYLYGQAFVKYTDISLKAAFIELDFANNLVTAELREDTVTGKLIGVPEFTEGEQVFTAKRMRYNFKTKKGMVYDVRTTQTDLFVHGSRMKLIQEEKKDTSKPDNILFGQKLLFTTCSAEHPHFGIRSTKQKIIPDKLAIVGPSQIEIMGVPTPLWLPFGFFPLKKGRSTGLLFPRDYEYSENWGFGLRDIGWYFPVGDHLNLALRSNIYFKGTYGLSLQADYRKRYKFSSGLNLRYDSQVQENRSTGKFGRTNSFGFQYNHNQEAAAHPSAKFSANINIQGNRNQSRVFNDAYSVLNSQLYSNANFSKNWPGKPYSLTASFNHSQNLNTRKATINFPNVQFQTQTLYPFKKKVSNDKWYETIAFRYAGEARNTFAATDTTLFTKKMWEDAVAGARHNLDVNTSFKVLKYINVNPNVTYSEVWQLKSIAKSFDSSPVITADTLDDPFDPDPQKSIIRYDTVFGTVKTDTLSGFAAYRQFSAGISLNTRIFFTLKTGKLTPLRAVRWEMRPNLSFNYSPNYLNPALNYFDSVQLDSRFPLRKQIYSRFDNIAVYGTPSISGRQMAIGYSLNNIFQAKAYSKKDSMEKKIKLIDNLVIGGNYNYAADSLKWSQLNISTTARFFKGITTMGFFMSLDPYLENSQGVRYNRTVWQQGKIIPRMETARFSFVTDLTVQKIREMFQGAKEGVVTDVRERPQQQGSQDQDFLSLFENFSISHNLDFFWETRGNETTFRMGTNSINAQGNVELTKNWGVSVGNIGYDFVNKGLSYPAIGFTRDLHCWQLSFNWQPQRGTYVLNIQVKPGTLDFIKIPYQKNNYDSRSGF